MPKAQYRQALSPGIRLLWYEIESVLGQGGFGITYLARDTNLDQAVALKEYLPIDIARRGEHGAVEPFADDLIEQYHSGLDRFLDEARTLSRFDHPNIVRVYSVFEVNATAYMVMRYEQGEALNELLDREQTLPQARLLAIVKPLVDGLEKIHAAGYIHRDIQPANIYLRQDGSPVLIDFGSARESIGRPRTVTILVAPGYAPIEQYYASGQEQGPWTDIYGLGATLYRAVTGVAPIDAIERSRGLLGSTRDIMVPAAVAGSDRYSAAFLAAIDHALMFNERDRPQTAAAWAVELDAAQTIPTPLASSSAARTLSAATGVPAASPGSARAWRSFVTPAVAIIGVSAVIAVLCVIWLQRPDIDLSTPNELPARISSTPQKAPEAAQAGTSPVVAQLNRDSHQDVAVSNHEQTATGAPATPESLSAVANPAASTPSPAKVPGPSSADAAADERNAIADLIAKRIASEASRLAALEVGLRQIEDQRQHSETRIAALTRSASTATPASVPPATATDHPESQPATAQVTTKADKAATAQQTNAAPAAQLARPPDIEQDALREARTLYAAKDYSAARRLLEPLALAGNAIAQSLLGNSLRDGLGTPADPLAALQWHLKAARQGLREAQTAVARAYALGSKNGLQEPFLAYTWFVIAEHNGAFDIAAERDQVSRQLQPEQLPQALALARGLQAQTAATSTRPGATP